jgi:hypothetical protein
VFSNLTLFGLVFDWNDVFGLVWIWRRMKNGKVLVIFGWIWCRNVFMNVGFCGKMIKLRVFGSRKCFLDVFWPKK